MHTDRILSKIAVLFLFLIINSVASAQTPVLSERHCYSFGSDSCAVAIQVDVSLAAAKYQWKYTVTNNSYNPHGGNGVSGLDFGFPTVTPPTDFSGITPPNSNWRCSWGVCNLPSQYKGILPPTGAGVFQFTTLPRKIVTSTTGRFYTRPENPFIRVSLSSGTPPGLEIPDFISAPMTVAGNVFGIIGNSITPAAGVGATIGDSARWQVDTLNGNEYIYNADFIVNAGVILNGNLYVPTKQGLHFALTRAYNSEDFYSGPLGQGWTHSYNVFLTISASAVTVKLGDGKQIVFQSSGGTYTPQPGVFDILVRNTDGSFTLTKPDFTVLTFDSLGRLRSVADKNRNTQTLAYNSLGLLASVTDVDGISVYVFSYDTNLHLTSVSSAGGRTVRYSVINGLLLTFTDTLGNSTVYTYNSDNVLTLLADPNGNPAVQNSYDGAGRIFSTTRRPAPGVSYVTRYQYDTPSTGTTTVTDPLGNQTQYVYNSSLQLIEIINALGKTTRFEYDPQNEIKSITNPAGETRRYTYDSRGNLLSTTDPLNHTTIYVYDGIRSDCGPTPRNDRVALTDANMNTTLYSYDCFGDLLSVIDTLQNVTSFTYDPRGNKVSFTNALSNTTSYGYNAANRIVGMTDPLGRITTYTYDAGGRLASETMPSGATTTLQYDNYNRVVSKAYSGGLEPQTVRYSYDGDGNRLSMTDPSGTTTYVYDALSRMTSVTFPGNRNVSYTYDANDNRTSVTYPDGKVLSYAYDALNRLKAVADFNGQVTTYAYDSASRVVSIAYPNSAGLQFTYDGAGRLTRVQNLYRGAPDPTSSFSYVLDNVGNRRSVTDANGTVTSYSYDNLYRILSAIVSDKATTYAYDPVGNRVSIITPKTSSYYTYDTDDHLLTAGAPAFSYDRDGNLILRVSGATTLTYTYNAAGRLISVTGGGSSSAFAYDGDGNRIQQTVDSGRYTYLNDVSTGFTTVLQESGPNGNIAYVRGRGLISETSPNFQFYYHYDGQFSVVGLTNTSGSLAQRYVYDVFGTLLEDVPPPQIGTLNKFQYTGEALDPGTGLYFYRARYYDPSLGRFISSDPFAGFDTSPQSLNRYVYVRNNPATLTDRTGFSCDLGDESEFPCGLELP